MSRRNKNLAYQLFRQRERLRLTHAHKKKQRENAKVYRLQKAQQNAQKRAEEKRHRLYRASEAAKALRSR